MNEIASRTQRKIIESSAKDWPAHRLELLKEYLRTGDIARGSEIFDAPKEILVKWARSMLAHLALTAKADYVKIECWKAILSDLKGVDSSGDIRVEIAIREVGATSIGTRIEQRPPA